MDERLGPVSPQVGAGGAQHKPSPGMQGPEVNLQGTGTVTGHYNAPKHQNHIVNAGPCARTQACAHAHTHTCTQAQHTRTLLKQ